MAKKIDYDSIELAANGFLLEYNPSHTIPVPIEDIIEKILKIEIIPIKGLLSLEQIDGFVSYDCKNIYIDEDQYMSATNRARFTLAHEVGHTILHKDLIKKVNSIAEWKKFVLGEGTGRAIYETEANVFASQVLVPSDQLIIEYESAKQKVVGMFKKLNLEVPLDEEIIPYASVEISKIFEVSELSITIRLKNIFQLVKIKA